MCLVPQGEYNAGGCATYCGGKSVPRLLRRYLELLEKSDGCDSGVDGIGEQKGDRSLRPGDVLKINTARQRYEKADDDVSLVASRNGVNISNEK